MHIPGVLLYLWIVLPINPAIYRSEKAFYKMASVSLEKSAGREGCIENVTYRMFLIEF